MVKISEEGCSSEVIINAEDLNPDPDVIISDIAYEQGQFYIALSSSICTVNPEDGSVKWVNSMPLDMNGLAGDQNGHLYIAGSQLPAIGGALNAKRKHD